MRQPGNGGSSRGRGPDHAQKVLGAVSTGVMPPQSSGEPSWPPESVQLFRDWIAGGYQA